jgi:hypothetical protein
MPTQRKALEDDPETVEMRKRLMAQEEARKRNLKRVLGHGSLIGADEPEEGYNEAITGKSGKG